MWGWGWGSGWGHGMYGLPLFLFGGFRLLFGAAVIVGVVFLVRHFGRQGWRGPHDESALDILQKRYARGEITREQYEEMKRNLG
ncbi:MAG: SHOCT domain-containing protein [Spirochaetia bacterium]